MAGSERKRQDVFRRSECQQHGNTLTIPDERGWRFCVSHARYVEPVEVEYVRADLHQDAVKRIADLEAELHRAHRMLGAYASHASVEILDAVMADMARDGMSR